MFKKLLLAALILTFVCCQNDANIVGGYTQVDTRIRPASGTGIGDIGQSINDLEVAQIYAKNHYKQANIGQTIKGNKISVKTQVVAGMNYKFVFQTQSGKFLTVVVYHVPWQKENPMKITHVQVSQRKPE